MKKVLLVAADGFSKTGVPTVFMNIVRNLSPLGYRFDIIYFDEKFKYFYNEFISYGGKAFLLDKQYKNRFAKKMIRYMSNYRYYKQTRKIISENGPYTAIHCFKEYRSCSFLKAAKDEGVSIRIYHNNNTLKISGNCVNRYLMKKEKQKCLSTMTKLVGCSSKSCFSAFGDKFHFNVVRNPYDESKFFFTKEQNACSGKLEIVQTAAFCDRKNQLFVLDVISALRKKYKNILMHFIGMDIDKGYKKIIEKKVIELNLQNNVVFHEAACNQKAIFDKCSYFILPSKSEAFGIVLIEAQACGLRCFASDETPEETNVGGCIRLSLESGCEYWANKIYEDYSINMGKKEQFDCSCYSIKNIINDYISLYE